MDKKRAASSWDEIPEKRRFRADALDLFLTGDISGQRAQTLFHNAQLAGAEMVEDLAKPESNGNANRDLVRKALKTSLWPQPYYADVRGFNPKTGKEDAMSVALFLPHELMASVLLVNDAKNILALQEREFRHRADIKEHLLHFQEQFGVQDVLRLGLWIDGVPFNHDRSQSVECISLNLPALEAEVADLRLPVLCFPKAFMAKKSTRDDLFTILSWSFRCLLFGKWPSMRHDSSAFLATDSQRKKQSGKDLGIQAALCELRGDWAMFKETLNLPGWQGKGPICFKCNCTLEQLDQVSKTAAWRCGWLK